MRMLLSIIELEEEKARLIDEKWRGASAADGDGGPEGLAYEQAFATGVAHGWGEAKTLIASVLTA